MNTISRNFPDLRWKCFRWLFPALVALAVLMAAPMEAAPTKGSDLGVGKTVDHTQDLVGSFFQFTVAVTNFGVTPVTGVVVGDQLPSGLRLASSTPGAGSSYNGATGMWTITNLNPGASASLVVVAQITAPGPMTNTATITSANPSNSSTNNSASVVVLGMPVTGLMVVVSQVNAEGKTVGPLSNTTVVASGAVLGTTDAQGQLRDTNVAPGTYAVVVTNTGFYSVTHTVTVVAGQMAVSSYQLLEQGVQGPPSQFDFNSLQGRYFIPAMPGNMTFSVVVAWNGTAGTATFNVNGTSMPATLTDLGNGTALATLTLPDLSAIATANQLTLNVVNGENLSRAFNLAAYFVPLPGLVPTWFTWLGNTLAWANASTSLGTPKIGFELKTNYTLFSNTIPSENMTLTAGLGINLNASYMPIEGVFEGAAGGNGMGALSVTLPGVSGVEVFAEGSLGLAGTLKIEFAGLNAPMVTPGWSVALDIKNGLKAPFVSVVPVVFPAATPVVTFLQNTWGIKSIVNSLKLGLTISEGGSVAGVYQNLTHGSCFLGTTGLSGSANAGLELSAGVELGSLKAKVYGGGNGTVAFDICPELTVNTVTLQAYVGVSAEAYVFSIDRRVTATLVFGGGTPQLKLIDAHGSAIEPATEWEPIGAELGRWGAPDQLVKSAPRKDSMAATGSTETLVVSNVLDLANPSIYADPTETDILFTLYDATKPFYEGTDIGMLRSTNGSALTLSQVTDDTNADLNPKVIGINSNLLLAAWERVTGDVSGATNPVQIAPGLEVAAAWFDRSTGNWSIPVQLTTNAVLDRDPLPVAFGNTQGILWVENQAGDLIGDATNGDSLLFSEWTGTSWTAPQTLWAGSNGIPSFSFVADGSGQGHVVFGAENDALEESELYSLATAGGAWQAAIALTNDTVENLQPTLVAPNGNPLCVWNQDGALTYSQLSSWNPREVFSETNAANDVSTLTGVTFPGGAAVGYVAQTLDSVDVYASFYNAAQDNWSQPRQLTDDPDVESSLSLGYDGTNLVAAFEKTAMIESNLVLDVDGQSETLTNVSVPGETDLYVLTHPPTADAGVVAGSLTIDPPNPVPGSNATISVVIENFGDIALQNIPVAFFDGSNQIGSAQIIPGLVGGATEQVQVAWVVPFGTNSHTITALVDPLETFPDSDPSNNSATQLTVLPDLAIDSTLYTEEGANSVLLVAQVINQGVIPAGASVLSWTLNGQVIGTNSVGPLAAGQSVAVTFLWNTAGQYFSAPYVQVTAEADSLNEVVEFDETNNDSFLMVPVVADWVAQITAITYTNSGVVQLSFAAANSSASEFVVQSTDSLSPPISWQAEPSAVITETSPGVFQAQISAAGTARFYRVQSAP